MDVTCYELKKIINHKVLPIGGVYFKIIWHDNSESWEPLEHLYHCDEALEKYYNYLDNNYGNSKFLRKLVNIIRKNKKFYHDKGELY